MAWIESHQALKDHPKVIRLCASLEWEQDACIGRLHRLWWWTLDYAPDGDLQKYNDAQIAAGMGVAIPQAKRLVEALVEARWLDREPYFRVHDWWQYAGRFLQVKWKHSPEQWQKARGLYIEPPKQPPKGRLQDVQPNQPNLTVPTKPEEGAPPPEKVPETPLNHPNLAQAIAHFSQERCGKWPEGEIRYAFNRFEADSVDGMWMFGRRQVGDWRAAMETRMHDERARNQRPGSSGNLPAYRQLDALEEEISKHPANPESLHHNASATADQKEHLKNLRTRLRTLKSGK